jgi:hypothetical protein
MWQVSRNTSSSAALTAPRALLLIKTGCFIALR